MSTKEPFITRMGTHEITTLIVNDGMFKKRAETSIVIKLCVYGLSVPRGRKGMTEGESWP